MSNLTRRDFTKGAALATAASYSKIMGANDRVRMGYIGVGNRDRGEHIPRGVLRDPLSVECIQADLLRCSGVHHHAISHADGLAFRQSPGLLQKGERRG
jgi:hypothetical protein